MGDRHRTRSAAARFLCRGTHRRRQAPLKRGLGAFVVAAIAASSAAPARAGSALDRAASELAGALGGATGETLVVAGALTFDEPTPKADAIEAAMATLVAGKLANARAHSGALTLDAARRAAGARTSLVWVSTTLQNGQLRASADRYAAAANPWDRVRNPLPPPIAHSFAAVAIDPEIRASMTPILLGHASVQRAAHGQGAVLAVACGDLDGDGGLEIVTVSAERIAVGKLTGGKFTPSRTTPWSVLNPRVPVPLREPVGSVSIDPNRITAAITDRGSVVLDESLKPLQTLPGIAFGTACARAVPEASMLENLAPCDSKSSQKWPFSASRFDAFASCEGSTRGGADFRATAGRDPSGRLIINVGDRELPPIDGAGAQIALADLDLDGVPELAMSAGAGDDSITIVTLDDSGARTRLKLAAPDGVRALATCPPEARDAPALIAVVGAEVWVVR